MFDTRKASENISDVRFTATLEQLETDLVGVVKKVTDPLVMLFDFLELDDNILEQIVEGFAAGEVK
jgi:hypothetical protein